MTDLNLDATNEPAETIPTPGQMLRELRELQKLSQKDVADSLNLRPDVIEKLESNLFEEVGTPLFVRGYLKSCARLYGVDEQSVISLYDALAGAPKQARVQMTSFSRRTKRETNDNRLMLATYVIVGIFILFVVMWWWQRDNFSQMVVSSVDDIAVVIATDAETDDEAEPVEFEPELTVLDDDAGNQPASPRVLSDASTHAQHNELDSRHKNESEATDEASVPMMHSSSDVQAPSDSSTAEKITINEQADSTLVLTFTDDCWLIITDGDGNEIANGVKKKDYIMSLTGKPPFSFVLGAPANVNINFEGKDIDMTRFIKLKRVARFSLPMTEG